jgi:2-polyprenyl-3-methyl-5-hydroxy-6-metoxy-1,4-benzoquinol methylase
MGVAGRNILDVGCVGAPLSIALLERGPAATLVAQDRPNVVRVALGHAAELGVADRMTPLEGSALEVTLGGPSDLILMMNVLEHFDRTSRRLLARRLRRALRPGGALVTYGPMLDPNRTAPPLAIRYNVFLLATSLGGGAMTFREIDALFRSAGFSRSRRSPAVPMVVTKSGRRTSR